MNKEKFLQYFILVVVLSALLIWAWNFMHGRNLAKAPQIDISKFDYSDYFSQALEESIKDADKEIVAPVVETVQAAPSEEVKLETGYIYFKASLGANDYVSSQSMFNNFLRDFPLLASSSVEDLRAMKVLDLEVPVTERKNILEILNNNVEIEKCEALAPPIWQITLKQPKYYEEIQSWLLAISPSLILKNQQPIAGKYIARIPYENIPAVEAVLEVLRQDYSDVVTIY